MVDAPIYVNCIQISKSAWQPIIFLAGYYFVLPLRNDFSRGDQTTEGRMVFNTERFVGERLRAKHLRGAEKYGTAALPTLPL